MNLTINYISMAIIRPTRTFEGGEFKQGSGSYFKPGTRVMNFRDKQYADGTYVFILGAYKEDSEGNGVWYKPFKIRDNFGLETKEKFAVQPNCPIDWFASRVKSIAPNFAKVEKVKKDGRDVNVYPAFGRTTWRVTYNGAFFQNLSTGVHILDLPQSGGASVIDEYVKGKQPDGSDNPLINDYQAAIPVYIKLDLTAAGQPWKIQVNSSKTYQLQEQLADTEYLYNLDQVLVYPSKEELIEKLRSCVPSDIFAKCMAGYSDGSVKVAFNQVPVTAPTLSAPSLPDPNDDIPMGPVSAPPKATPLPVTTMPKASVSPAQKPAAHAVAPAFSMPKATSKAPRASQPVQAEPQMNPEPDQAPEPVVGEGDDADLPRPPVPQTSGATLEMAKKFLQKPVA